MLYYKQTGHGNPIMMIHGFPFDHTLWHNIAPRLETEFKVLLPDLPGAGASKSLDQPLSLPLMAKSILEILDNENIDKVVIIGHSMGGYTAMVCAQLFPERIKGIALVHSLASSDTDEKKVMRQKAIKLITQSEAGKLEFLKAMAGNMFGDKFANENPEALNEIVSKGMLLSQKSLADFYTAIMNRSDNTDILKDLPFPMLWVMGTEDKPAPIEDSLKQSSMVPICDVRIFENVGHMSMIESPDLLTNALSEFCHFCQK